MSAGMTETARPTSPGSAATTAATDSRSFLQTIAQLRATQLFLQRSTAPGDERDDSSLSTAYDYLRHVDSVALSPGPAAAAAAAAAAIAPALGPATVSPAPGSAGGAPSPMPGDPGVGTPTPGGLTLTLSGLGARPGSAAAAAAPAGELDHASKLAAVGVAFGQLPEREAHQGLSSDGAHQHPGDGDDVAIGFVEDPYAIADEAAYADDPHHPHSHHPGHHHHHHHAHQAEADVPGGLVSFVHGVMVAPVPWVPYPAPAPPGPSEGGPSSAPGPVPAAPAGQRRVLRLTSKDLEYLIGPFKTRKDRRDKDRKRRRRERREAAAAAEAAASSLAAGIGPTGDAASSGPQSSPAVGVAPIPEDHTGGSVATPAPEIRPPSIRLNFRSLSTPGSSGLSSPVIESPAAQDSPR
ncbi:hypothetical protein H696_02187 [Fonticula alba]|uniref:Uncharacterized protein n=1 Tax=Fonticula alba TaxID=691883 RepID=A0A058ZCS3_FONAL|nr:hypothetical protein H696_02187 [Fonticula alba]KCV71237.1 hypothetical protein H696_02187 [Fonticula alba]|eukprot:XP_009494360.1 hypothetical protein H696_02187 [Fonticula alba]